MTALRRLAFSPLRSLASQRPSAMPPRTCHRRTAARLHHLAASLAPAAAAAAQPAANSGGAAHKHAAPPGYRLPPAEIREIVDMPPEPILSFSPDRKLVLQLARPPPNPPIAELARPELKLAGMDGVQWAAGMLGAGRKSIEGRAP